MSPTTPQQSTASSRSTGKLVVAIGLAIAAAVLAITWKSGQRSESVAATQAAESGIGAPAASRPAAGGPRLAARAQAPVEAPPTPEELQQRLLEMEKRGAAEAVAAQRYWTEGFAAQSVNPAWARPLEAEVRKIIESDDFDAYGIRPKDLRIECRSSLCKVTGIFASQSNADDWMRAFTLKTADHFSGGATEMNKQPNGEWLVRVFTSAKKQ